MAGGLFDDLVPAGATTAPPRGLFDDLIPHQGQGGGKGALGREQDTTLAQKEAAYAEMMRGQRDRQGVVGKYLDTAARGIARAVPFMDDIAATGDYMTGLAGPGIGLAPMDYREALVRQRAMNRVDDTQRPVTSIGGQVLGSVAIPIGAANNLGQAVKIGAGLGAAYGFGAGGGTDGGALEEAGSRIGHAIGGALLGGALGGAGNVIFSPVANAVTRAATGAGAGAGIGYLMGGNGDSAARGAALGAGVGALGARGPNIVAGALDRLMNAGAAKFRFLPGAVDPEAAAAQTLNRAFEADRAAIPPRVTPGTIDRVTPLTDQEYIAAAQARQPVGIVDAGRENVRALARSAANQSPEARNVLENAVTERVQGQTDRLKSFMNGLFPDGLNNAERQAFIAERGARVNAGNYERAYRQDAAQSMWDNRFAAFMQSPAFRAAVKEVEAQSANRAAISSGRPIQSPFIIGEDGRYTIRQGMTPTLEFWDHVQRILRDQARALTRSGKNYEASNIGDLQKALVRKLDSQVPEFADARSGAARFFQAEDALEAGANFVGGKFKNNDARAALGRMNGDDRELFAESFAERFINAVRESGDRQSIINSVFVKSPAARERIEIALGPQRARQIEAFLRAEAIMDNLKVATQGNSTTARQLLEMGLIGGGGAAAGYLAGGQQGAGVGFSLAGMTQFIRLGLRRANATVDEKIATQIAEMLVEQNPSRYLEALRRVANSPRATDALRKVGETLPRTMAPTAPATTNAANSALMGHRARADEPQDERKKP